MEEGGEVEICAMLADGMISTSLDVSLSSSGGIAKGMLSVCSNKRSSEKLQNKDLKVNFQYLIQL